MRLNLWSPLPPVPFRHRRLRGGEPFPSWRVAFELTVVVEDPDAVDPAAVVGTAVALRTPAAAPDADLDLYQIGNSPAHAFVYRAALARPGVVVLHEWSLHHLVLHETVERGDVSAYLREMRRAHGEAGTFVGRQVARALGGDLLPALFPLNDRLLESSLGIVALTEFVRARAAPPPAGPARAAPPAPPVPAVRRASDAGDGAPRPGPARGRPDRDRARPRHRGQGPGRGSARARLACAAVTRGCSSWWRVTAICSGSSEQARAAGMGDAFGAPGASRSPTSCATSARPTWC